MTSRSILGCATVTMKVNGNQDYWLPVDNRQTGISGLVMADGIGSHYRSEDGARFCCESLRSLIEQEPETGRIDFNALFGRVSLALSVHASDPDIPEDALTKQRVMGTTLICVLETTEEYLLAYTGNGSIWHVDGRFSQFGPNRYLPWNAVNLLNPHCIEIDGQAVLHRFISATGTAYEPTVLCMAKNRSGPGEIIVVTTDGIYSKDNERIGKDQEGTIWIRAEEAMIMLFRRLDDLLVNGPESLDDSGLQVALMDYLEELKTNNLIHDDATVGVIISGLTVAFYQELSAKKKILPPGDEDDPGK